MNTFFIFSACCITSYLLGAVPFGCLIARLKGIDIRQAGSGNIGATNVFRVVGKGWGLFTFFCDVLKGFTAAFFFPMLVKTLPAAAGTTQLLGILCACSAVAGHNWPVYLRFKGGKGIATSAGALLGIAPVPLGFGLISWLIVFPLTRYVSLASIAAALVIPASGWFLHFRQSVLIPPGPLVPAILTLLGALGILRHKTNIQRLIRGTENRFGTGKKK